MKSTRELVAEERRITVRLLAHFEEIERRKLYLESQCSSLFEFCMKKYGYSENEAHTRISAMRLSREVPQAVEAMEAGRLSLTNLSKARTFFRSEQKAGRPMTVEAKQAFVARIEGLSTRELEKVVVAAQGGDAATFLRSFRGDAQIEADLRRIREIWGNQDLTDTELLRKMCRLVLGRIEPGRGVRGEGLTDVKPEVEVKPKGNVTCGARTVGDELVDQDGLKARDAARALQSVGARKVDGADADALPALPAEMDTPRSRYITAKVRREVWRRDGGRCAHTRAGQRCGSRYALQFHHLYPYGYGGVSSVQNLVLLCRAHQERVSHAEPKVIVSAHEPDAAWSAHEAAQPSCV